MPNAITASRMVLAPLTLFAHQQATEGGGADPTWLGLALLGLAAAEVTDILDGVVARRIGQVSDFGKLLDPLSDSIFRMFVFLSFLKAGWMPLWMVAILFARDIVVAYLRVVTGLQNVVMAARASGKIKAVVQATAQIAAVVLYLFQSMGWPKRYLGVDLPMPEITWGLCLIATVVTAWSAWDYTRGTWLALRAARAVDDGSPDDTET